MNNTCTSCALLRNAINGRFCKRLGVYVEYSTAPPCRKSFFVRSDGVSAEEPDNRPQPRRHRDTGEIMNK